MRGEVWSGDGLFPCGLGLLAGLERLVWRHEEGGLRPMTTSPSHQQRQKGNKGVFGNFYLTKSGRVFFHHLGKGDLRGSFPFVCPNRLWDHLVYYD